jgi:hypothetical protein
MCTYFWKENRHNSEKNLDCSKQVLLVLLTNNYLCGCSPYPINIQKDHFRKILQLDILHLTCFGSLPVYLLFKDSGRKHYELMRELQQIVKEQQQMRISLYFLSLLQCICVNILPTQISYFLQ